MAVTAVLTPVPKSTSEVVELGLRGFGGENLKINELTASHFFMPVLQVSKR